CQRLLRRRTSLLRGAVDAQDFDLGGDDLGRPGGHRKAARDRDLLPAAGGVGDHPAGDRAAEPQSLSPGGIERHSTIATAPSCGADHPSPRPFITRGRQKNRRQGRQAGARRPALEFRAQCIPAPVSCIILKASSIVKVLGFWMGGKSLKVAAHCPITYCAPYRM